MSRGAEIPIRTFSPITDRTDTSMSSPIMMLWLDFRVRTSIFGVPPCCYRLGRESTKASPAAGCNEEVNICAAKGTFPLCTGYIRPHVLGCGAPMARRSLRPQLNQIRTWVRQGRTDAWIAHQLKVTVQQIEAFRRDNDLGENGDPGTD